LSDRIRRLARWSAGLLLLPGGGLTAVLFFATGRPVPCAFVPADQMGFILNGSNFSTNAGNRPFFQDFSFSGRCFVTLEQPAAKPEGERSGGLIANVMDTSSVHKLASFQLMPSHIFPNPFDLSPDKSCLIAASIDSLQVWHIDTGKTESIRLETPWEDLGETHTDSGPRTEFSTDGSHLLIWSMDRAIDYDLFERKTRLAMQAPEKRSIVACYYDAHGRPKAVVNVGASRSEWQTWDLASNQREVAIESYGRLGSVVRVAAGVPVVMNAYTEPKSLLVSSLEDGALLKAVTFPPGALDPFRISPDGRFLICQQVRLNTLSEMAKGKNDALQMWLEGRFPPRRCLALCDMKSGSAWFDLQGQKFCAFSDDCSRLISITNEGRYEYDVPPRWQYFTPWVWAALGGWLGVATAWWQLRKRKPGVATVA
jgi:hypothetical protein